VPCSFGMSQKNDEPTYPIVLTSWAGSPNRAAWVSSIFLLIGGLAVILLFPGCHSYGCESARGTGYFAVTLAPIVWFLFRRGGTRGLELRIDREGFVLSGRRVPWDAVMSILWNQGRGGEAAIPEHIEVRVRSTEGYRAPRDARIQVYHREYGVPANVLIDAFEAAAVPRRIYVLAIEPPAKG
jgi:hypothetical protein